VTCCGGWGVLKLRITVFVTSVHCRSLPKWWLRQWNPGFWVRWWFLLWYCRARSRDRTTPLQELRLLCGETFTGTSASDVIPRSISEYFLLFVWTSKSPRWRRLTVSRVPIWAFSDLPIAKTVTWSSDCRLSSLDWITSHLGKCSVMTSSSELPESGQLLLVWCRLLLWVMEVAMLSVEKFGTLAPHPPWSPYITPSRKGERGTRYMGQGPAW